SLVQGASGSSTISTTVVGSGGTISLTVSGTPSGASASVTPTSVSAGKIGRAAGKDSAAAAGADAPTGTGTEGAVTHRTTVKLTGSVPSRCLEFRGVPCRVSLVQGASGSSTISTTVVGSGGTISLAVSGTPSGASASVTPTSVSAG